MKVIFRQRFVWQKRITVQNFYKIALFFQKIMHFQIVEITITSASPLKKIKKNDRFLCMTDVWSSPEVPK